MENGMCRDTHLMCAAEFTKDNLIYVGYRTTELNKWFNGYIYDLN